MTKKYFYLYLCLVSILSILSCSDVFEIDLEDDKVILIAPQDKLESNSTIHTFWWEELEGADEYRLQIVHPSFDSIETLIVDSIVMNDQFTVQLQEGEYQWRVIGQNDTYESRYEIYMLRIMNDSSASLSTQTIGFLTPESDACTNNSSVVFTWSALSQADTYTFQIGDASFNDLLANEELLTNNYSFNLPDEATYHWRVRAENNNSLTFTPWASANITLDQTSPEAAQLSFPAEGATIFIADQNPDLGWASASDSASDTLYIYADENADTLLLKTEASASFNLDDSNYNFDLPGTEDYFWEILSVDKAGNISPSGELRLFYVDF